jgi:tripartite-type tricarboxylate transporter receptor subunit TctC
MSSGNKLMRLWLVAVLWAVAAQSAWPEVFPARPVRLVVPSPPGGGSDILSRLLAQKMTESLSQAVIVENRAGGDGIVGSEWVARATADGYTILVGNATALVANIYLRKNLPYDPVKDFTPVAGGVESITCIAINAALPIRSVAELIDYAKKNPGNLTYGSSGAGGAYHMSGEALKAITGTDIVHVPYKGLAPALTGMIAGQISAVVTSVTVVLPQVAAGKARILAFLEERRYAKLPEIPLVRETIPAFRGSTIWNGFFAPAGTPAPVVNRLNAEFVKALNAADIVNKMDATQIIGGSPEQFGAYWRGQIELFGQLARLLGITPQ